MNIFLNARKVTHTIDDHLPIILRNREALRSHDHSQGILLALRNAYATTDAAPGLELQLLLIEMGSTHGTRFGTFSTGHTLLGVVFTYKAAIQEYLRRVKFVQTRQGHTTASAAVA
jgi:hypothetical protein